MRLALLGVWGCWGEALVSGDYGRGVMRLSGDLGMVAVSGVVGAYTRGFAKEELWQ